MRAAHQIVDDRVGPLIPAMRGLSLLVLDIFVLGETVFMTVTSTEHIAGV